MKRKIVFWSAVDPTSVISNIVNNLRQLGYDASIRFIASDHDYRNARNIFERTLMRLNIFIVFPVYFIVANLFNRSQNQVNIVTTNPFFLPYVSGILFGRRRSTVQLVWDLYPEVLHVHSKKSLLRVLAIYISERLVTSSFAKCAANVFITESMLRAAKTRSSTIRNSKVIAVGTNDNLFKTDKINISKPGQRVSIVYSGNMGLMHDIYTLKQAFNDQRFSDLNLSNIFLSFYSFGVNYENLKYTLANTNLGTNPNLCSRVKFYGPQELPEWIVMMKNSHVSIVSLASGAESAALPSKTYSSLAAGHAILCICDSNSELAKLILHHNCGWVVDPGDFDAFIKILFEIKDRPDVLNQKRCNAYALGHGIYSSFNLAKQWSALLDRV